MIIPVDILSLIIVFILVILSISFHEASHAYASNWLGDNTAKNAGRLTLNPLKHIDVLFTIIVPVVLAIFNLPIIGAAKPVPYNKNNLKYGNVGVALVAIAGPVVNFILSFVFYVIYFILSTRVSWLGSAFYYASISNICLFLFNLIPIPPLDGSRVLYLVMPDFIRNFFDSVEQKGLSFIFIVFLYIFSSFIGNYVYYCALFFIHIFAVLVKLF
jgi:Zn-dependent protease